MLLAATDVGRCPERGGGDAVAVLKDDASDLSATFSCAAGQDIVPGLELQTGRTGDECKWQVPLKDIADRASLERTTVAGSTGLKSYRLTIGSLPEKPRLFCFICDAEDQTKPGCYAFIYAPAARKTDEGSSQPGQVPDGTKAVVSTTTADPTNRGTSAAHPLTTLGNVSVFLLMTVTGSLHLL